MSLRPEDFAVQNCQTRQSIDARAEEVSVLSYGNRKKKEMVSNETIIPNQDLSLLTLAIDALDTSGTFVAPIDALRVAVVSQRDLGPVETLDHVGSRAQAVHLSLVDVELVARLENHEHQPVTEKDRYDYRYGE